MSAQAISFVWDTKDVTPEEKLILLFIGNSIGDLAYPYCPEWIGMGEFTGTGYESAAEAVSSLIDKRLLIPNAPDGGGWSHVWVAYGGPYEEPVDWFAETKSRSKRVIALIERDGPQCAYCDCLPVIYEVDHFIPKAKGGADRMDNLVLACPPCNRAKRDKHPKDFLSHNPQRYEVLRNNLVFLHEPLSA